MKIEQQYIILFNGKTAEERIRECERELVEINGSWEDIVKRMQDFYYGEYNQDFYEVRDAITGHHSQAQPCMVVECQRKLYDGSRKIVRSIASGLELWISRATMHMVEEHKLLQVRQIGKAPETSENRWGINPKEFYQNFMI